MQRCCASSTVVSLCASAAPAARLLSSCSGRPPPPPREGAGEAAPRGGGAPPPALPADVRALLSAHPIVVFTRSYCSFCKDLVERVDDAGWAVHEAQLEGDATRDVLRAHTGQQSVPFVFVKGQLVDADAFADAMKAPGDRALALLHAVPRGKGYFRP